MYPGKYRGTDVAIKVIRGDAEMQLSEIEILCKLRHPRILTLMGVVQDLNPLFGKLALVTEYMVGGSLFDALHGGENPTECRLASMSAKLRVLKDIAEGMTFLHWNNVIHRDLKSLNVLLDEEGRAKICDFGLSTVLSANMTHASAAVGTPAWSSPEALLGDTEVRKSTDVYSFGVILWEMLTGQVPWCDTPGIQVAIRVSRGESLPLPVISEDTTPQSLVDLLLACLNRNPDSRPSFEDVVDCVIELLPVYLQRTGCRPEYVCPISLEVMIDPVICSDGQTYDRVNIERWLQNNNTSPISNAVLNDLTLRPNIALRKLILEYSAAETLYNELNLQV